MNDTSQIIKNIAAIYELSPMAVLMMDSEGEILWSNAAFKAAADGNVPDLRGVHTGHAYERSVYLCGKICRIYVSPVSENASLVNITPVSDRGREYISVISAAVRKAVSAVSAASDNLAELCSSEEAALILDTVEGTMLTLLSEILIPEEIAAVDGLGASDFPVVSVSEDMRKYAAELGSILAKYPVEIRTDIAAGMFSHMNMRAVRLILTDFAVKAMEGEYHAENIAVRLMRSGADTMKLTLACGYLLKIPSEAESRELKKPAGYAPAAELKTILEERFGCRISYRYTPDFSSVSVEIPMCQAPLANGLRAPSVFFGSPARFSDENAYFSRYGVNSRYKNG